MALELASNVLHHLTVVSQCEEGVDDTQLRMAGVIVASPERGD